MEYPVSSDPQIAGESQQRCAKEITNCPRCGKPYGLDDWNGECNECGYPDIYYDSLAY